MKRVILVVSVLSISLFILGTVESSATPLAILNPSFESNQPADGGWIADPLRGDFIRTINDWTIIGGARPSGTWQPTTLPYPSGVLDGLNVAYVGVSNAISQVLSETLTANYRYSLSVYVGHRSDKTFPINYSAQLYAGGLLAEENSLIPLHGEFLQSSLVFDALPTDPNIGNPLEIRLVNLGGNQVSFDMVTLDHTPIPEPIEIDIKPGSDPNCLNINGKGVIPVSINGSEEFDVFDVDVYSLAFAGLDVRVRGNDTPQCRYEDWNGDGYTDLVCNFEDNPDNWSPDNGTATLAGELFDGTPIQGSDNICIVP